MKKLNITIISKEKVEYQGQADAVFVPTQTGIIEVLPQHMQLISALKQGEIVLKKDGQNDLKFKISAGVLEVRTESNVIILADIVRE